MGAGVSKAEGERDEARKEAERFRKEKEELQKALEDERRTREVDDMKRRMEDKHLREKAEIERRVQEAEEKLLRGIPPDIRPTREEIARVRAEHGYRPGALNIAVTGESGSGKSSLLNALRCLYDDDEGAAKVGINETTTEIQPYPDPNLPNVQWYDIPGANTLNVRGWLYFTTQHLYTFDALIVVFSDRFTETAATILQNAHQCGIPTYLVRTKSNQLIANLKREDHQLRDDTEAVRRLVEKTKETVHENLAKLNLPMRPVYILSADGMRKWLRQDDDSDVIDERTFYKEIFPDYKEDVKIQNDDGGKEGSGAQAFVEIWQD